MTDLNLSNACAPNGDGQCNGYIPDDDESEEADDFLCDCPCHNAEDLPLQSNQMRRYHDAQWKADPIEKVVVWRAKR